MKCPKCKSSDIIRKENSLDSECRNCGNSFRQIFVSYGHDRHADFVKRLAKAVEERSGYKIGVWIDHVKLREGANWRREITSGIDESYGAMAFLSRYSSRERGVCLDELAIAISSKHGMIKSVLLEEVDRNGNFVPYDPEDPAAPPPAVTEYQWADMSDYHDHASDEEEYGRYVNEKADMIISMLQSDEVESYNRELAELRKRLALPTVSRAQKFDRLVGREIVGRKWLTEKINGWLNDKNGARIMMLYGKPGSGKSMFAAHLQHYNPSIAAAFACDWQSSEYSETNSIISWLAYKLAMRIPEYRGRLLSLFSDGNFTPGGGADRFANLISGPLGNTIDGAHPNMIVLIDAIDEVKTDELARFVTEYAGQLTPWIRILITARREPQIEQRFEEYPSVDFEDFSGDNENDLREYYEKRLGKALENRAGAEEFYKRLEEADEGLFAYAEKVCDNILEDLQNDPDADLVTYKLPKGLHALFLNTLDRKKFEYQDRRGNILNFEGFWQRPLGMIASSPDPLPVETLRSLMGWRENAYHAFIAPLSTVLTEVDGCITVFHRSFAEWLDTEGAGKYHTSKADGLYDLAETCFGLYESDGADALDEYVLTHITRLLRKAGMKKEYEKVKADGHLVDCIISIGNRYEDNSRFAEAIAIGEELVTLFEDASDEYASSWLALSLDLLGRIFKKKNELKKAESIFETELKISQQLAANYPHNPVHKKNLTASLERIAGIYKAKNELKYALELYEQVLSIRKLLVAENPGNPRYKRDLSVAIEKVAGIYRMNNDLDHALELHSEELAIDRQLVNDYPQVYDYKRDLTKSLEKIAGIYREKRELDRALELYEEYLDISKRLVADCPLIPTYRRGLSVALERIGEIYKERKELDRAAEYYSKALDIRQQLVTECPQDPDYKRGLSVTLCNIAGIYERKKEFERALDFCEKDLIICKQLVADYPQNPCYKRDLSVSFEKMAGIYEAKKEYDKALGLYKESLSIRKKLVSDYPQSLQYTEDLAVEYFLIGMLTEEKESFKSALEYAKRFPNMPKCKKIIEALTEK